MTLVEGLPQQASATICFIGSVCMHAMVIPGVDRVTLPGNIALAVGLPHLM